MSFPQGCCIDEILVFAVDRLVDLFWNDFLVSLWDVFLLEVVTGTRLLCSVSDFHKVVRCPELLVLLKKST